MKSYELAQIEFTLLMLIAVAIPLVSIAIWLIRHRHWHTIPTSCLVIILACLAVAWTLADSEDGKPIPPQVRHYMRLRKEWVKWTHTVRQEWQDLCSAIQQGITAVQHHHTYTIATTNAITRPAAPMPTLQFRPNLLQSPNQNIKARVKNLTNNGDGTWTVEVQASREIYDEPDLLMYLRRRSDGLSRWVEHESTSFPSNTSTYAYSYTFRPPEGIDGYVVAADEVLLGGPNGLTIEGVVYVDPIAGHMYEGISGDYIIDERPVRVVGGVIKVEANTTAEELPAELFAMPQAMGRFGVFAEEQRELTTPEPTLKLSMPPMDGGTP